MKVIEYDKKYDEQIKDLLVELQEHLIKIDDWNTQVMSKDYREDSYNIDMQKVKEQSGKIYLAEQNDRIVGLVIGVVSKLDEIDIITNDCAKTGIVLELVISKDYQRSGIGKALLLKIEEYFKLIECQRVNIEVFGPNISAHNFYNKNGYIDRDIFVSKRLLLKKDNIYITKLSEDKVTMPAIDKGKIIAICGKICSGKSYYANQIKEKENAIVLSTDEVTQELINNEQGEFYDRLCPKVNAYLMKKSVEIINIGCNVILDWGFWSRNIRKETTDYYKTQNIDIEWHYIDIDDDTWEKNIAERNKRVKEGNGGSDFYVTEGLKKKVLDKWEEPNESEVDVWYCLNRK